MGLEMKTVIVGFVCLKQTNLCTNGKKYLLILEASKHVMQYLEARNRVLGV